MTLIQNSISLSRLDSLGRLRVKLAEIKDYLKVADLSDQNLKEFTPAKFLQAAYQVLGQTRIIVASSFQDALLVHLVTSIIKNPTIVFIDTGSTFDETYKYIETLKNIYEFNLVIISPDQKDVKNYPCGHDNCCRYRKVEPFNAFLKSHSYLGWITGIKRFETKNRQRASVFEIDINREIIKINPFVYFSQQDVDIYLNANNLPMHPLRYKGYGSIGCKGTTQKPLGQDLRSGRWAGQSKTECGLHI